MKNSLIKLMFISILMFYFIGINVKVNAANDNSYYVYVNDINNNLVDIDKIDSIQTYNNRFKDIRYIDNNDILNKYVEYSEEDVTSSKNVIILLIILIIIGLIQCVWLDKNE